VTRRSVVFSSKSAVFPRELDRARPLIVRGEGMWLFDSSGRTYLDAVSGGAMTTNLGHAVPEIVAAARDQALTLSYLYDQQFTSPPQEELASALAERAPAGFGYAHFACSGADANEAAIRLARAFHVERGDTGRWRIISPAQAYHGPTMATLALTGRGALHYPYAPYLTEQLHIPPSTWRFDPSGEAALAELDRVIAGAGAETIAAFFCEPVSSAALPAYSPPARFWEGLSERRERYGFLVCFDEVVTGLGRTGSWFAADQLPLVPDLITVAKGLGCGFAAIAAVLCSECVYEAVAAGSRAFELGHTWGGAPVSAAVGLAVIGYLARHDLIRRVRERGEPLLYELEKSLADLELVREVRGRGFLLGVSYVDPRDGESLLDPALRVARRIDEAALERELLVYSTQPTADGYVGDQTLLAPAFIARDVELNAIIQRFAAAVGTVEREVKAELRQAATVA
jgi:adenosylmethionine-8-amino-7-oxononanoate aminotransferase